MAEKKKTDDIAALMSDASETGQTENIILGEFAARAINDGGAEIRLSDEKAQGNILLRKKGLKSSIEVGAMYEVSARKIAEVPQPKNVVIEVPTEVAAALPEGTAKVIE